jgi:hypothetical protein
MEEIEIDYVPEINELAMRLVDLQTALAVLTEDDRIQSDAKVAVCLNLQREIDSITNELNQVKLEEENVYEQTSELHSPQK